MANHREESGVADPKNERRLLPATVARVLDAYTVVINRGGEDGIKPGQRLLIYGVDLNEVSDPETNEKLGPLEIVRGRGVVSHVQSRIATVKSSERTSGTVTKRKPLGGLSIFGEIVEESSEGELLPFDAPTVGDKAKPV